MIFKLKPISSPGTIPALIGFLAFRIVFELLIQRAVTEGVAPPQMSWDGLNFDIIAGVTAPVIAPIATRLSRMILLTWNTLALTLVLWAVSVAVRRLPTPLQQFEPTGLWVMAFPFVWLPYREIYNEPETYINYSHNTLCNE